MSGGLIALAAMALFIPFSQYLCRRLARASAISAVVLVGSLFLPEGAGLVSIPLVQNIDKEKLTYLCALVGILLYHQSALREARLGAGPEALFLVVVLALAGTWSINTRPMLNYGRMQEPLGLYWLATRSVDDFLTLVLPFVVGRLAFRSRADLRTLAYALVGAGLVHLPLVGLEALMSIPFRVWQLGDLVYGVRAQPSFRWGGLQPVVFMENALSLASFLAMSTIMAAAFAGARSTVAWRGVRRAHLLTLLSLLLTRVTSSGFYGLALGAVVRVCKATFCSNLALAIAVGVCIYPAMRLASVFPDEWLVQVASDLLNEERARSFQGRFLEEDFVFAGLVDRIWLGWGMFDRIPGAALFGVGEVGLDSFLVIRVGMTGIVGTELLLMMLMIPVWLAWRRLRLFPDRESQYLLAGLMLCVAARMVDFLLNGLWNGLPFFLAGALYGIAQSTGRHGADRTHHANIGSSGGRR